MRSLCLSAALGLAFFLIPPELPAQVAPEETLARWKKDLQSQDSRLRLQDWKSVAKASPGLVEQMVDGMLVGEASAAMLGLTVIQQAVAESGLGHQEEAVWLLHLAQNLDARYREVTLGSYGPAGAALDRFRLRQAGEAPAAWPTLPAAGSFRPPRVLRQDEPKTPDALARALVTAEIEVEMVVGPDGRVSEPVLLTEPEYPSLAFVILESLRGWRFEPARAADAAVPALFRTRISHAGLQKAAAGAPTSRRSAESFRVAQMRLANFDAHLRRGAWQTVHGPVEKLVAELRASGPEDGSLAQGLRVLALAEAGVGQRDAALWHWQVAQNLRPDLELDPAAYGEAGAFLAQHKLRRRDEAPAGMEAVAVAELGPGSTPPRKIAGEEPMVPDFLVSPRAPRWVRLQAVIDPQGRVVEPVVLAGRFEAMRWAALEAVRTWRFEPARRGGQPVAVLLDIQLPPLPPRAGNPLAEMLPLTGELGGVHDLLLKHQWREARRKAAALVESVADEDKVDPLRSAVALAFFALADAGEGASSALCYWHAAQSLHSDLDHADLAAYGTAGALLEAGNPWRLDEKILRVGTSPTGETVKRPEKIAGGLPTYGRADRLAMVSGSNAVEVVVNEEGRVSQPWLLKSLSPGLDLKTLVAVCDWRFKPATSGGKPVKVYYELTVHFSVQRGFP
jgi:TonB family protein